jgi:hypothetical protein
VICPFCGIDITVHIASEMGKLGGPASAASLTKRQRRLRAQKAGRANTGTRAKSLTRSESMKAAWALRRVS